MILAPLREPQTLGGGEERQTDRQRADVCMHAGAELDSPHCRGQLSREDYKCAPGTIYVRICMCVCVCDIQMKIPSQTPESTESES